MATLGGVLVQHYVSCFHQSMDETLHPYCASQSTNVFAVEQQLVDQDAILEELKAHLLKAQAAVKVAADKHSSMSSTM